MHKLKEQPIIAPAEILSTLECQKLISEIPKNNAQS
jgi:hypothetical protein